MSFTTWTYVAFLAVAVALRFIVPAGLVSPLLLGLSLVFYAWVSPTDLLVLLPLLAAIHVIARRTAPGGLRSGRWLATGITLCVGLLVYYKYQSLAVETVNYVSGLVGARLEWVAPQIQAPLGISFFVFLLIHYLVEVHRGNIAVVRAREEALFVLFFPTVVSGPLKRIDTFSPQTVAPGRPIAADLYEGLSRIVVGLSKKTLVADQIAPLCQPVFVNPGAYDWAQLWLAAYGYSVQIYFDFAGYSDMAIGSARVLGFRVPENFDYPYFRTNIAQFWRHWHMTLTGWIMQYIYFPLGGNRRGAARASGNRFVAMAACGLWHGSAFHFAVWGAYHGLLLNLFQLYRRARGRLFPNRPDGIDHPLARFASGLLTFHFVAIGWVFFAADLRPALHIVGRMLLVTGP